MKKNLLVVSFPYSKSQKVNLKYIKNWPVATKPWAICNAPGKRITNSKSLFCNNLLALCPSQPEIPAPQSSECCIVDAMRIVRIIPISDPDENAFRCCGKHFVNYLISSRSCDLCNIWQLRKWYRIQHLQREIPERKEPNITSLNQTLCKSSNQENLFK